jgi:hypothetical protein
MDVEAKIDLRSLDLAHSLALTDLIRFALAEIASSKREGALGADLDRIAGRRFG